MPKPTRLGRAAFGLGVWAERVSNLGAALRRRRSDDARMRWSRDQLLSYQQAELAALVTFATERSPYYRERYGGVHRGPVDLTALPTLPKASLVSELDRIVTDSRLSRAALDDHIASLHGDEVFAGEYRVMVSSGSSGARAVFAYDRAAWRGGFMTGCLRMGELTGINPRLPRRLRIASVAAPDGKHMTFRGGVSMEIGLNRRLQLSAATPLPQLCTALDAFAPDVLFGYPSMLALLAEEQRAHRLNIAPRHVSTSGEVRTDAMTAAIRGAWGVIPYDVLGMTETGIAAVDCDAHAGLHLFEDLCIVEAVDERGRPVPPRTAGARTLVTNLYNRALPIIRLEVSDLITVDDGPCSCGRTLARISALDGRSDDILTLPGPSGPVLLHPIHVRSALAGDAAIVEYQVIQRMAQIDVEVVLAAAAPPDSAAALAARLDALLTARGAAVTVHVRPVTHIVREAGAGKLKVVRAAALPAS